MTVREHRLGELLHHTPRPVRVDKEETYSEIGIRSHGKGIFHKPEIKGVALGDKKVFYIEPGDFVLNIVFAWEGAVALAGEEERGRIGSHRFPTFRVNERLADPRYLLHYFRTPTGLALLLAVSPGGAGRNRTLNRTQFLERTVTLPAVSEQRERAEWLDRNLARLDEARLLRTSAQRDLTRTASAYLESVIGRLQLRMGRLADVLTGKPRNGWSPVCTPGAQGGVPVLALGAITGFQYDSTAHKRTLETSSPGGHYWLRPGDLLITRSNTAALVGHAAIYDGAPSPCIYPDLMMRLPVDPLRASVAFAHLWLQTTQVRSYIRKKATGTSPTMKKISQGIVMDIPFPLGLSLTQQSALVEECERFRKRVAQAVDIGNTVDSELALLRPALVARAFQLEQVPWERRGAERQGTDDQLPRVPVKAAQQQLF